MKRFIAISFFLCLSAVSTVSAQLSDNVKDKLQLHSGLSFEFIPIQDRVGNDVFNVPTSLIGLNVGGDYGLVHSNDVYSLSVSSAMNVSMSYSNYAGFSMLFQLPTYLHARVGANATNFNESTIGAGAGLGLNYTYIKFPYENTLNGSIDNVNKNFISPSAMAEITFLLNGRYFTVRYHMNLLPVKGPLGMVYTPHFQ